MANIQALPLIRPLTEAAHLKQFVYLDLTVVSGWWDMETCAVPLINHAG